MIRISVSLAALLFVAFGCRPAADVPEQSEGGPSADFADGALSQTIRVMTFNIRYDNPGDGASAWPLRATWLAEVVARENPDVLGVQEALRHQVDTLAAHLPGHAWTGGGRDDGKDGGEFAPLFYRSNRFSLAESGMLWLSPDPDSVGSVGWDAALTRVATWARLVDRVSGDTLTAVNTHFDHRGEVARLESARLLTERFLSGSPARPVVLTGDLNFGPDAPGYSVLAGAARDAYLAAERTGPEGTWSGFREEDPDGDRIDFIFARGPLAPIRYRALDEVRGGLHVSDHRPVVADFGAGGM